MYALPLVVPVMSTWLVPNAVATRSEPASGKRVALHFCCTESQMSTTSDGDRTLLRPPTNSAALPHRTPSKLERASDRNLPDELSGII
jgi:hypothetical protein